jgi:hypothetical protein
MRTYIAFFKSRRIEFEASSLYEAKMHALVHFKPSKRDAGLIAVVLADTPIDPASL